MALALGGLPDLIGRVERHATRQSAAPVNALCSCFCCGRGMFEAEF